MAHRSTGPLTPEHLKELAQAPFGEALEAIRQHDPLHGRGPGERFKWRVWLSCRAFGEATVMAADEGGALEAAAALDESDVEYNEFNRPHVDKVAPA
jgi:hypothetical protein